MPNSGYFDVVFGNSGDLITVPDALQPSGSVSYTQGWPILYSTPVGSGGYNIARGTMNQLFYDVTSALQQYQQNGIPPFITTAMNNGSPYSYAKYAVVLSGGVAYQSLVASNADTPPSAKWAVVQLGQAIVSTQSVTGTNHTFASGDNNLMSLRSNSGAAMIDTLPGTGVGVLAAGWQGEIVNNDASGLLFVSVGSGAAFNGSATGSMLLGPGQRAIVFSDGSNYWAKELPGRTVLGANTTFYVATTGSDSANNGIVTGSPYLTIQKAVNTLARNIDLNGFTATIQVADGTYTGGVTLGAPFTGGGSVIIQGNTTTPANCIISTTSANCFNVLNNAVVSIQGFKLQTTTSGYGVLAQYGAQVNVTGNMNYGVCAGPHVGAADGGRVVVTASYTISGAATIHWESGRFAEIYCASVTVTLTGTPAFATVFAIAGVLSTIQCQSNTFTGSATGTRYSAVVNGAINTNGGGATYLPGNAAGSTSNGGQYV